MAEPVVAIVISLLTCVVTFAIGCAWMHRRMEVRWSKRVEDARDWAYEQGMADMYATKAQMYEHWRRAVCRPSIVAGVVEAEGRHRVLDSPTAEFERIMHVEFIQEGIES